MATQIRESQAEWGVALGKLMAVSRGCRTQCALARKAGIGGRQQLGEYVVAKSIGALEPLRV